MKSLVEYINESIITEKFGSKILTDLFTAKSKKGWAWDRISSSLKWDKITDADIEELSIKDAIKISKDDNNDYIIYASKNHAVFARTIGTKLLSVEDKISTITGLSRKYNLDKAYRILNWEGFSTSALHKERSEMASALRHIQDPTFVKWDNIHRYEDAIDKLKANKLLTSDYQKAMVEMVEMLGIVTKYIMNDENSILTRIDDVMKAQEAFRNVISELRNLVKFQDPNYKDDIIWAPDDDKWGRLKRTDTELARKDAEYFQNGGTRRSDYYRYNVEDFDQAIKFMNQTKSHIKDLYDKYKDQLGDYKVEGF